MSRLPFCLAAVLAVLAVGGPAAARSDAPPEAAEGLPQPPGPAPEPMRGLPASEPPSEPAVAAPAVASWFGPGLYGGRTACGQTLTSELTGVAHRTLPCGALVTLLYGDALVTVPVVDRGPFHAAREFDLTYATRLALGCPDLCRLAWVR